MFEDDLIREIHAVREEYCRRFDYDFAAIFRDLREQERTGGRKVVSFPPRRVKPSDDEMPKDASKT